MIVIPFERDKASFSVLTTLDGVDYLLRLEWNSRAGWFMGLYDNNEQPIFHPKKLSLAWPMLFASHHDPRCPAGELIAMPLDGNYALEPGYQDFTSSTNFADNDGRCALLYATADELASGAAASQGVTVL